MTHHSANLDANDKRRLANTGPRTVTPDGTKMCNDCSLREGRPVYKFVTEFYPIKTKAGNLTRYSYCIACTKIRQKKWRWDNPEKYKALCDRTVEKHRDEINARRRARYAKNPEKERARIRESTRRRREKTA